MLIPPGRSRRDPQIGDSYQPRKVIAEIVNLDALQARIYILEKEAGSLGKGKPVVLRSAIGFSALGRRR